MPKRAKIHQRQPRPIPMSDWGKDHWSLLAYVECRCVDDGGIPGSLHLRCNPARHPQFTHSGGWKSRYSTRLKDHTEASPRMRQGHDDWNCADDLAHAGLVENCGSGINPLWKLTKSGLAFASALRSHKAASGNFGDFNPSTS